MLRKILAAVGRAIKAMARGTWAALEDVFDEPGAALGRTWDTVTALAGVGKDAVGAAARGAEGTANAIGSMMPSVNVGGGGYVPPEPDEHRLNRPYSNKDLFRNPSSFDFDLDLSSQWLYAYAYLAGGRVWAVDGMEEGWRSLGRMCPDVKSWALALTETERGLVKAAGCEAMDHHLRGDALIPGVRSLASRNRVPDGILGGAPVTTKKPVVFELDDGWDMAPAPVATAI